MKRRTLVIAAIAAAALSQLFFIPGAMHLGIALEYLQALGPSGSLSTAERILYVTDGCSSYFAGGLIPLLAASIFFLVSRIGKKK